LLLTCAAGLVGRLSDYLSLAGFFSLYSKLLIDNEMVNELITSKDLPIVTG